MKKKQFVWAVILLFAPCSMPLLQAQSLVGRVYSCDNIMADKMAELTKEVDKKLPEAKAEEIAKQEKKKGRKLTEAERADVEKKLKEASEKLAIMEKGIKTGVSVEFKSETHAITKMNMVVEEEALKQAGVSWAKRKAMKAALALAPSSQKTRYVVKGNLVIMNPHEDPDTLRLSADGKYLYGEFDKKTDFKLTRTK